MPDGGIAEDFLHIVEAGPAQGLVVSVASASPDPLRGRCRSRTSQLSRRQLRRFLRDESMPEVKSRYRTTKETAIIGESLAGLFVVDTFLLEPDLLNLGSLLQARGVLAMLGRTPSKPP
jgi:hypothetical protein